jgi:hypothetical protein
LDQACAAEIGGDGEPGPLRFPRARKHAAARRAACRRRSAASDIRKHHAGTSTCAPPSVTWFASTPCAAGRWRQALPYVPSRATPSRSRSFLPRVPRLERACAYTRRSNDVEEARTISCTSTRCMLLAVRAPASNGADATASPPSTVVSNALHKVEESLSRSSSGSRELGLRLRPQRRRGGGEVSEDVQRAAAAAGHVLSPFVQSCCQFGYRVSELGNCRGSENQ